MTRRKSLILSAAFVLVACTGATGCLDAILQQTIYIEPDGSVTSEIVGLSIRSVAETREVRLREEREFLEELSTGVYEEELFPLGASSIRTTVVRNESPYTVVMTGRYRRADDFFAGTLETWFEAEAIEARLDHLGDETRLVVALRTDEEDTEQPPCVLGEATEHDCSEEDPFEDSIRIILTEGRFVEAEGFEIDGDVAIPLPEEFVAVRRGARTWSLTWTAE